MIESADQRKNQSRRDEEEKIVEIELVLLPCITHRVEESVIVEATRMESEGMRRHGD